MARGRILIVDDEVGIRNTLRRILEDEGYTIVDVESGEECLGILAKRDFDLMLLDVWLPGIDGLEVLKRVAGTPGVPEVIVISGHGTIETAVRATRLGAFDFIEKPLSLERILVTVENALKKRRLEEKNRLLRSQIGGEVTLVGESAPIVDLREQIAKAAPTEGRVLIFGENGTGKELVARLVHASSDRSEEAFIEINCAAIPAELIESELFGHRKGSFTGAIENKMGKFLLADGGTLFLDEVGDMSLTTQAKVLRVLQEQTFERVGGGETIKVDVRVIAATNKDLGEAISGGEFREDLFYRLNVIPITVPPLRERRDDIPLLAKYYLDFFAEKYGRERKTLSEEALEALADYAWPGNVRELKNLMERMVIMLSSEVVTPSNFLLDRAGYRKGEGDGIDWSGPLKEAREKFEKRFIEKALERNDWNVTRTSKELSIERRHLYRRMAGLGIKKENRNGND